MNLPIVTVPDEVLIKKIFHIRGNKVILDFDLAELYQVETKRLNEQVKRNVERFPADFMFQLSDAEWENLRSQIATSSSSWGGRRIPPYAFTEHGVLMLSSVLKSDRAVQVNIHIMRFYIKLRGVLMQNKEILLKLGQVERGLSKHDRHFAVVFDHLKQLITSPKPTSRIGFRQKGRDK